VFSTRPAYRTRPRGPETREGPVDVAERRRGEATRKTTASCRRRSWCHTDARMQRRSTNCFHRRRRVHGRVQGQRAVVACDACDAQLSAQEPASGRSQAAPWPVSARARWWCVCCWRAAAGERCPRQVSEVRSRWRRRRTELQGQLVDGLEGKVCGRASRLASRPWRCAMTSAP